MAATRQRRVLLCSLVCGLPFATVNLLIVPLESQVGGPGEAGAVFVFLCMGVIGAEAALHAIWCVLAPTPIAKRLAIGIAVGLVLYGAWALGYSASFSGRAYRYWEYVLMGLLCLPLLAIATQSPLWLARIWLRWRIEHREEPLPPSEVEPFRIRDLLAATAALALALSAIRLGMPEDIPSEEAFLIGFAIAALVAAAVSLFTTLPVVAAALRTRRALMTLPAILLVHVATLLGVFVILSAVFQEWPPAWVYAGIVAMGFGFSACLAGVLLVARGLGYRLAWGRLKTTPGNSNSAPPEHAARK